MHTDTLDKEGWPELILFGDGVMVKESGQLCFANQAPSISL